MALDGSRLDRHAAARIIRSLARKAGITERVGSRTTMRYDRARQSRDRHATYIVATFVAGASR